MFWTAMQYWCSALYLCVINLGEILYIIEKKIGLQSAQLALSRIKAIPLQAAHIKASFAISYADCFAASVCIAKNALLVTGMLRSAHQTLMENHLHHCFSKALESKQNKRKLEMIEEILKVTKLSNK